MGVKWDERGILVLHSLTPIFNAFRSLAPIRRALTRLVNFEKFSGDTPNAHLLTTTNNTVASTLSPSRDRNTDLLAIMADTTKEVPLNSVQVEALVRIFSSRGATFKADEIPGCDEDC